MKKLQLNKFGLLALAFGLWLVFQLVTLLGVYSPLISFGLALVLIIISIYLAYSIGVLEKGQTFLNKEGLKTIALGWLVARVPNVLGTVLIYQSGEITTENQAALEGAGISLYLLLLFVVFLAPVVEEFIFRGLLMGKIFGKNSSLGLIISSLLFAVTHIPTNLGSWVIYAGMGFVLGYCYRKTGRLDYVIGIHFLQNFLVTMVMLLS